MSGYRGENANWTEARTDRLKKLWAEGKSATEIMRDLGGGVTRSAVIGKVHRLKLEVRGQPASFTGGGVTADGLKAPPVKRHVQAGAVNARQGRLPVPEVGRTYHRPTKPGPQNKPGAVFGAYQHERDFAKAEIVRAKKTEAGIVRVAQVSAGAGVESPNAVPLLDYVRGCKWPLGERGAVHYCCNPQVEGRTYCEGHLALSLNPVQPDRVRDRDASRLTRFDRVERDTPRPARVERTLWDDARLEAA